MRTILTTSPLRQNTETSTSVPALSLFFGKTMIQHVVEALASEGHTQITVVLDEHIEEVKELLGDGTRWGIDIDTVGPCTSVNLWKFLATSFQEEGELFVASACTLPVFDRRPSELFAAFDRESGAWTGWGRLNGAILQNLARASEDALEAVLKDLMSVIEFDTLSTTDAKNYFSSYLRLLENPSVLPLLNLVEVQQGVWIDHNASIDSTARLTGPVYIGANCRVDAGAELGPFVALEKGGYVHAEARLRSAVVGEEVYVEEGLSFEDCFVQAHRLVKPLEDAVLEIDDPKLFGSTTSAETKTPLSERLIAALLFLSLSPLLGVLALLLKVRRGYGFETSCFDKGSGRRRGLTLRTFVDEKQTNPSELEQWVLSRGWNRLPALGAVVSNELRLVGYDVADYKETLIQREESVKPGLFQLSAVQKTGSEMERWLVDSYFDRARRPLLTAYVIFGSILKPLGLFETRRADVLATK